MRWILRILVLLVLLLVAGVVTAVLLAFDDEPLVVGIERLTPAEVERALQLIRANDPRRLRTGEVGRVSLTDDQVALVASYLFGRFGAGGAQVHLGDASLELRATGAIPRLPIKRFLNVEARVLEGDPLPRVASLRVGKLQIPRWLAGATMRVAIDAVHADSDARAAAEMIRAVRFSPGQVQVTYRWQQDTVDRLRARLVPAEDRARLRTYNDHLLRVARDLPAGAGLHELLGPLLTLAAERSDTGDAVLENRFALLVLEANVNGRDLGTLVPEARQWPEPRRLSPTLQGRRDFPQHFMTSALVAALAGTVLADAIGLYKELDDARGGSGFSFTDFAANRAGTRFGERSVRSAADARAIQQAARGVLRDADLMPPVRDLPEHMGQAQFSSRFGGPDDPRYLRITAEIERRLDTLPLYR
jgi:hypothetical protein